MSLVNPVVSDPGRGPVALFFPHAGGSPRFFRHLAEALPRHRVFGVTYPGRDHLVDQTPLTELQLLVERTAAEVADRFGTIFRLTGRPLLLAGHSLGAFVAYETAVTLRRHDIAAHVIASGQNPPHPDRTADRHWTISCTDDDLLSDVIRQNPGSAGIWQSPELRAFFLPTIRADYRLLGGYRPTGGTVHQVSVVAGRDDQEIATEQLGRWQRYSDRTTAVTLFDGGHFYLERPDTQLACYLDDLSLSQAGAAQKDDHV